LPLLRAIISGSSERIGSSVPWMLLRDVQLGHGLVGMVARACGRDDHIHAAAELALDGLGDLPDLLRVGDVGLDRNGLAAQRLDLPLRVGQRLAVAANDHEVGARLRERQRDRLADALGAAGDGDDLAFEFLVLRHVNCPFGPGPR
jgi:hypothetical protein